MARSLQLVRAMLARCFATALLVALVGTGCSSATRPGPPAAVAAEGRSLTAIVAELQMHLRDDTYRYDRPTENGANVFQLSRWRLERLQARRGRDVAEWENVDRVIEYARARALERLRLYSEASSAYARVALAGSLLLGPAEEGSAAMARFAAHAGPSSEPFADAAKELAFVEGRIRRWEVLALEYVGTPYASLAREEAEAWEELRVDGVARNHGPEEAILAARRLVERHHDSKRYAQHLIRLGDLYAGAARGELLASRAGVRSFAPERYQGWLDRAFSSYELARDARRREHQLEAQKKIEALLAYHQGIRSDAP